MDSHKPRRIEKSVQPIDLFQKLSFNWEEKQDISIRPVLDEPISAID
ncbi:hypothetical protein C5167_040522 [Papaver somniferum]|uniref:Uncharacterized protein n=1 Tax=Papaver somniferum TaxID=3469 RepID=A0A4Y7IJF5_PAPSO|nr:hypothetical protein C5167_040522 [Papaver somniferum]